MTATYRVIRGGGADVDDLVWAEPLIADFGRAAEDVADEWHYRKSLSRADGNNWLREVHQILLQTPKVIRDVHTTDDLDGIARWIAEESARFTTEDELDGFVLRHELPEITGKILEAKLARARDWQYWRRRLRKPVGQFRDQITRHIGRVHRHRQIYCSNHCLALFRQQQRSNKRLLDKITMVNEELEQECNLGEVVEGSVANPEKRRLELLTRINGMERYSQEEDHKAVMVTITTPSAYHAHHADGRRNRKWNGTTPKEANDYLCEIWRRIRASLQFQDIEVYGFRTVEPHHDGTPHWHLALFVPLGHAKALQDTIKRYALEEDGDEPGAQEHRVSFEWIDPDKGSMTGYSVKYVCKGIDGHGVDEDLYGNSAEMAAERMVAWARTWGIRQFQQIGGPSVTVWREYRRLRDLRDIPPSHITPWMHASAPGELKPDWCAFMRSMGGHVPGRKQPTRLVRGLRWCAVTGECTPPINRYGETLEGSAMPITGLTREGIHLKTRTGFWRREWNEDTEDVWGRSRITQSCTALSVVINSSSEGRTGAQRFNDVAPQPAAAGKLFATITATGARLTGMRTGRVLRGKTALAQLPPGDPNDPNARWSLIRDGEAAAPWTGDNNCRFEKGGIGLGQGPPS